MKFNKSLTLLLISIGLITTSTQAVLAEDTISKSSYDWTGVYVGGFVGGAAGTSTSTQGALDTNGNGTFDTNNSYGYDTKASFIGGGTVGYNWQIGKTPYLVGLEGEYGYLDMNGSSTDSNNNLSSYVSTKNNLNIGGSYGYGVVGGRIGYALDRTLFYIKSGAVFTNTQARWNGACCVTTDLTTSSTSNSVGYAIGGGVEYALPFIWSKNISIKTEYLYLGINRTQAGVSSFSNDPSGALFTTTNTINGISTAKIGVNYKF